MRELRLNIRPSDHDMAVKYTVQKRGEMPTVCAEVRRMKPPPLNRHRRQRKADAKPPPRLASHNSYKAGRLHCVRRVGSRRVGTASQRLQRPPPARPTPRAARRSAGRSPVTPDLGRSVTRPAVAAERLAVHDRLPARLDGPASRSQLICTPPPCVMKAGCTQAGRRHASLAAGRREGH